MSEESRDDKFLTLDWAAIEQGAMVIAEKILESGFFPQVIVGVLRGGWVPARLLSDFLSISNIGAIEIKFYKGIEEKSERPVIVQPLVADVKDKNVLVVDDVADSGKSLQVALSAINLHGPKTIKTAALYVKPWSVLVPDYYYATTDKWIVFPWEKRETIQSLIEAEYKILSRASVDREKIAKELSGKLKLSYDEVQRILNILFYERKRP